MNKLFIIILSLILSLPIVWAVDETSNPDFIEQNPINQLEVDKKKTLAEDYKQPTSTKNIAKKFLAAMGGVALSSFTIFAMLTVYNRIREKRFQSVNNDSENSLETPETFDRAIKTFLDKTDWS